MNNGVVLVRYHNLTKTLNIYQLDDLLHIPNKQLRHLHHLKNKQFYYHLLLQNSLLHWNGFYPIYLLIHQGLSSVKDPVNELQNMRNSFG